MGFSSRPRRRVIIIGGGVSGIATACRLARDFNLDDYYIYDRQDGLGGTWLANTYPGCAVDIPGFCYSYSFAPNPDFTQMFPSQAEILQCFSKVAQQYRVEKHFRGGVEWIGAAWQEKTQTWIATLKDIQTGQIFSEECQVLISAVGGLVNPQKINIPGVEHFQGEIIHTARWRSEIDLTNKHVAVIGNGASASQLIPAIIDKTSSVTQFMRSPHHIVDATNHQISPEWRSTFRRFPFLLWLVRLILFLYMEITWFRFQNNSLGTIGRKSVNNKSRKYVQEAAPESYWDLLIPRYEFGCRRRIFDRGYLASLHKNNMRLSSDPISKITSNSIVTSSGEELYTDVILLATGFDLTHYDVDLRGRNGKTRQEHWKEYGHKATYKSIAMSGFPNFFYIMGPIQVDCIRPLSRSSKVKLRWFYKLSDQFYNIKPFQSRSKPTARGRMIPGFTKPSIKQYTVTIVEATLLIKPQRKTGSFIHGTHFTCGSQRFGAFPMIGCIK